MKFYQLIKVTLLGALSCIVFACAKENPTEPQTKPVVSEPAAAALSRNGQPIEMSVTSDGFVPSLVLVRAGQPVKLVVTRKVEKTCATEIVIEDFGINKSLPLNVPVEVSFTPTKPGKFRYSCAMNMIAGELVVE
jgi:plastocyanin domain-containing protein